MPMECYDERIASAPLPTKALLRRRKSVPVQLVRFITMNVRILRMVFMAHDDS
jgi:hypothetical protein